MNEMKKCPFCDSKNFLTVLQDINSSFYVRCGNCLARGPLWIPSIKMTPSNIRELPISEWNKAIRKKEVNQ